MEYNKEFITALKTVNDDVEDIDDYDTTDYSKDDMENLVTYVMVEAIADARQRVTSTDDTSYFGPIGSGYFYSDDKRSLWLDGMSREQAIQEVVWTHTS